MSINTAETIYPCPFSKGYGIPAKQAWVLLKVFLIYRFVLGCLLIILFYSRFNLSGAGSYNSTLYSVSSQSYLFITVISATCIFWKLTKYSAQAQLLIFTDIIILTFLMHACGGIISGMGILLVVSIAAGGLLIGGRCAMLFAALASLSVLTEQIVVHQTEGFNASAYSYAGMLGAAFFTIALLSYILAKRSEEIWKLADQRQQTIVTLEDLNQYIIQHLQFGIIIVNKHQAIQMTNETTLRLIDPVAEATHLVDISADLSQAFETWLVDPNQDFVMLQLPNRLDVYSRFSILPTRYELFYMVMLEDISRYNQRVQQSKLASLGRLTASIAHEIRNPLGAISHAGQLLSENPALSAQDKRLTEIIQTHCSRVNYIIEDILHLSKRTDSRRERILLKPWLEHFLENFSLEHAVTADAFELLQEDEPLSASMDPGHLKQIMDNLCRNALKYGKPEAGKIILHTFTLQHSPCIEVVDNGSGIGPEQLKYLFEPFFTTSPSGTGLGLYISRELAELNQAKLSYHLTDNNRSCFRLCLPDAEKNL